MVRSSTAMVRMLFKMARRNPKALLREGGANSGRFRRIGWSALARCDTREPYSFGRSFPVS